jgi:hypothetical protein
MCHLLAMERQQEIASKHLRLILAGERIEAQTPGFYEKAYMTPFLVQATLPHRQPRNNPPEWFRRNGNYVLSIRPGYSTDRNTGQRRCLGYPSGAIPRLLLFWIITEVARGASRHIYLGDTLSSFMRELDLNPRNGRGPRSDAVRLEREMQRLFAATISFEYSTLDVQRYRDMLVAPERELWWDHRAPDQPQLWKSSIRLGEQFYQAINANPFPVDMRALHELKASPLALDVYAWATYKTFLVTEKGKPQSVPWCCLKEQLGTSYSRTRDFKRYAMRAVREVAAVYHGFRYKLEDRAIVIYPGRTAIAA